MILEYGSLDRVEVLKKRGIYDHTYTIIYQPTPRVFAVT